MSSDYQRFNVVVLYFGIRWNAFTVTRLLFFNACVLSFAILQEQTTRLLICMTCLHFNAICLRPSKTTMLVVPLTR